MYKCEVKPHSICVDKQRHNIMETYGWQECLNAGTFFLVQICVLFDNKIKRRKIYLKIPAQLELMFA